MMHSYSKSLQQAVQKVEKGKRNFRVHETLDLTVDERLTLMLEINHRVTLERCGLEPTFERIGCIRLLK